MSKTLTIEDCRILARNKGGKCLSSEYKNSKEFMLWECDKRHKWDATLHTIKHGQAWCPECAHLKRRLKDGLQIAQKIAKGRDGKCLSKEYINNDELMSWECKEKHRWLATFSNIDKGNWCPECAHLKRRLKYGLQIAQKVASDNQGKCLSSKYIDSRSDLRWECKEKHRWFACLNNVKDNKTWCFKCKVLNSKLKYNYIFKKINSTGGILISKQYLGSESKLKIKCSKNHIFYMSAHAINRGQWCPECKIGKTQNKLKNILEKIVKSKAIINYRNFDWLKNPKTNRKLEIDIWFPKLKLAVEYDGEQHFKPINFGYKTEKETMKRFEYTKTMDELKNTLIGGHREYITNFIRFNYKDKINETNIIKKLKESNIL